MNTCEDEKCSPANCASLISVSASVNMMHINWLIIETRCQWFLPTNDRHDMHCTIKTRKSYRSTLNTAKMLLELHINYECQYYSQTFGLNAQAFTQDKSGERRSHRQTNRPTGHLDWSGWRYRYRLNEKKFFMVVGVNIAQAPSFGVSWCLLEEFIYFSFSS